ncbi:MAG: hypothetical protein DRP78_07105, partial [Candidatus Omnitrophota bacterium]
RIIGPEGEYHSETFNVGEQVEWGTISGTVTLTGSASAQSETVGFKTSLDSFSTQFPALGGSLFNACGSSFSYQAILGSQDAALDKTTVLEDVTITYLPKTEVLFYSQCVE